jgi:hypothetical protein
MAWPFLAPFRRLVRLAGSRWRYSTPPPHGFILWVPHDLSPGIMRPRWETERLPPSSAEMNSWSCNSTPPIRPHGVMLISFTGKFNIDYHLNMWTSKDYTLRLWGEFDIGYRRPKVAVHTKLTRDFITILETYWYQTLLVKNIVLRLITLVFTFLNENV